MQVAMLIITKNEDHIVLSPPMDEGPAREWVVKIDQAIGYAGNTTLITDWATFVQAIVAGAWVVDT
jgi:hypothetical protein